MAKKTLMELKKALEEEREALLRGAIESVLRTASYKARLVEKAREEGLSEEDRELLKEILHLNERNKALIEAGLSFVEEAFAILRRAMTPEAGYGKAASGEARLISREA
ncbi:flagellar protein FlgN [Thermosulfurimonas sp. F29]|uniref:flagellar protein FlgN n=1 Tax=Thermosulfurimonas sp. F29 TaxID=2867247 RepID=UPI001C83B07A|nr:flagellar protein FlgN [Thermosulfurimonas sp. F29]MBX6422752.1 flagellar protein FlgN [Thermosulfurimonas sp. F29]